MEKGTAARKASGVIRWENPPPHGNRLRHEHVCCVEGERAPRWHESLFSFDGFMVLMALGMVVAVIVYTLGGAK